SVFYSLGCCVFLWFVVFCLLCNRWQNTSKKFLNDRDISSTGPRVAIAFTFFCFLVLGVLVYWVHLAYNAVRLLTVGAVPNDSNNFSAYTDPSVPTYRGFTRDAEMLDPTGPTSLDSDMSPFALGKTDGAPAPSSAGAVFTGNLIEAYQP
ncbi:Synaptogyrin-1, partial [Fasciolopsis buskii]